MVADVNESPRLGRLAACLAITVALWWLPVPEGVEPRGWQLLAIFGGVIAGLVLRPFAMGPVAVFGLLACLVTGTLQAKGEAFAGYGDGVVWLVVGAFVLADAVQGTGLGRRVALLLVVKLGRTTLGLGYAQAAAELILGPVVPSNTARGGGILAPISASLAAALGSEPRQNPERAGAYLSLVGAQTNLVTAAMFLTGMAANPLFAGYVEQIYGYEFGWGTWALACLVPGLTSLALLPLLIYRLHPPEVRDGRPAQEKARQDLRAMGALGGAERVMGGVFVGMLLLWGTAAWHGISTVAVAWLGVGALILTRVHPWERIIRGHRTWDTLVWLGALLSMANGLKDLGVVEWFVRSAGTWVEGWSVLATVLCLAAVYFYSMVSFSMLTAHISAMALAFLGVCHAASVPAALAAPLFGAFSNLCACTTMYSTGPTVIYFGQGFVGARTWFGVGFAVSLLHLAVWFSVGLGWWKLLGYW